MPMTAREFAQHMSEVLLTVSPKMKLGARAALHDLHAEAYNTFGDLDRLRDLLPGTQAQRSAEGYTPNDPLLASGSERETLGMSVGDTVPESWIGNVGSDDKRLYWQEVGTVHMAPLPLLSVATYIAATRYNAITLLVAESMMEGIRGIEAMTALLSLEQSRDHETEATEDAA